MFRFLREISKTSLAHELTVIIRRKASEQNTHTPIRTHTHTCACAHTTYTESFSLFKDSPMHLPRFGIPGVTNKAATYLICNSARDAYLLPERERAGQTNEEE